MKTSNIPLIELKKALEDTYPEIKAQYYFDESIACLIIEYRNIQFWISPEYITATDYYINNNYYKIPHNGISIEGESIKEACALIYNFMDKDYYLNSLRNSLNIAIDIMGDYTEDEELAKACEIIINVLNEKNISKT